MESSNNVTTESSVVPTNDTIQDGATVDDTTDGQEVVTEVSTIPAISVVSVTDSNNSSILNSSDPSTPTQSSSIDSLIAGSLMILEFW